MLSTSGLNATLSASGRLMSRGHVSIGSHLVFYVEAGHGVDVIRILHQRMDPTRHL